MNLVERLLDPEQVEDELGKHKFIKDGFLRQYATAILELHRLPTPQSKKAVTNE